MTKHPPQPDEQPLQISIGSVRKTGDAEVLDDRAVIPGAIKPVNEQPLSAKERKSKDHAQFLRYAQLLVDCNGDAVEAISRLYGMSESDVSANLLRLRDEIHAKGEGMSAASALRKHDVDFENRIAVLKKWMYSPQAAPALKSVELLENLQGKAGQRREGVRAEDVIRAALALKDDEESV